MLNILILDDENMSRMAMESLFINYGTCKLFSTGKLAVQVFIDCFNTKDPFGLIILDISLENENGVDVLKLIRLFEKVSGVAKENQSVIMMATGNSETDIITECVKEGCDDYLVKPLKKKIVAAKMEKYNFEPLKSGGLDHRFGHLKTGI